MIQTVSAAEGFANSRHLKLPNGGEYVRSVFMGSQDKPKTPEPNKPTLYTVRQMPHTVVEPHYHAVGQWQVIVGGSGTLGRNVANPVALHYVDPYTGYGPITAGEEGLTYYTVRAMADPGAQFVSKPEAKAKLMQVRGTKKRYLYLDAEQVSASTGESLRARTHTATDPLVPAHDDGVAAWMVRMGPHADMAAPDARDCGGQALLVIGGALCHADAELPPMSCAFVPAGEGPMRLRAGDAGAEILVLQFARNA